MLDIFGYRTLDELKTTLIVERYTRESYAEFRVRRDKRKRGEYVFPQYEISIMRKDGEVRYLEVFRRKILWDGEMRFQVLYHDITERRKAEEDRAHLESLLRAVRNVNQLITREHDRQRLLEGCCEILCGVREYSAVWTALINSAGKSYLNASAGLGDEFELLRQRMFEGRLPKCARLALEQPEVVFLSKSESKECYNCQFCNNHSEQGRIAARINHKGQTYGVLTIAGDESFLGGKEGLDLVREVASDIAFALFGIEIEEQNRQTSLALQEAEAKYHDLYENAPVAYYSADINGFIRDCNKAGHIWVGYKYEELIGANCRDFYTEESRIKAKELFEKLKQGHKVEDEEMSFVRRDKEIIYGLLSISAVKDDKGKIIATRGIVKDITERRKLTQQLMMQDRLVSIGELVSGVAHEINNPLTGIIGFSEMLLKRDFPEEAIEDIQAILDESKRIAGIVRNLLTFARKQPQEKAAVNINEIVQRVLALRAYEQRANKIKVITDFAPELAQVQANASQLQQVFLNLVINAEYFMKEVHGKGTLTLNAVNSGDFVRISVADDGPGISAENMRHLFNPFFTTKPQGKGVGLGLSISKGIIEEHGGRLYAESQPGKGATFVIELPITRNGDSAYERERLTEKADSDSRG